VDLYIYSPKRLHGVVLNYLSTRTTLPYIQNVPGGRVNILGGHSIGHSKQKLYIVTDLLKAFLHNGSVNTFQRTTMENVFQWTNVIGRC
jgi:hypothetical protein